MLEEIRENYLKELVAFLHSIKWIFCVLNTQYVNENVILENNEFLESLNEIDLNDFPELKIPQNNHPKCLQKLVEQINSFNLSFVNINTDSWRSTPVRKLSVKKQYEIENVSKVIRSVCGDDITQLIDFGSGLGYLGHYMYDNYGYSVLGLESCDDRVEKAIERQMKYHPSSVGRVKHAQHFISCDSENFILEKAGDAESPLAIFGLHGCGDLTVTAIKLFLNMSRVKKLIFMPCCYHKMSATDADVEEFNLFPLSDELKAISANYRNFLNRPFLRLGGQQSPAKWRDMTKAEHWIHGKNMFERALVEAVILEDEAIKRIQNLNIPEDRVTMDDITVKYQLLDKATLTPKDWQSHHHARFTELRAKYPHGEELSENLFCLQTAIQSNCESLILVDRIRFIEEEAKRKEINVKTSVKKLQNDKLSPRCLILIAEKFS
jgi:Methyltransferase domain